MSTWEVPAGRPFGPAVAAILPSATSLAVSASAALHSATISWAGRAARSRTSR
jgi:hypothetical protein